MQARSEELWLYMGFKIIHVHVYFIVTQAWNHSNLREPTNFRIGFAKISQLTHLVVAGEGGSADSRVFHSHLRPRKMLQLWLSQFLNG